MPVPIWAGHYIGLRFREHGRDIYGVDCWGLVRLILSEQFGVLVPSYISSYSNTRDSEQLGGLIRLESKKWVSIEKGLEKKGDVIVLRMRGAPMHVGMVLGDRTMIHVEDYINSSIEKYNTHRWKNRVVGFYRHKEV